MKPLESSYRKPGAVVRQEEVRRARVFAYVTA